MKKKSPQKLVGTNSHRAMAAACSVIFPSERDLTIFEVKQPMVGDGNAMGVAGEILQDVFGAAERQLGINNPVLPEKLPQKALEHFEIWQAFEWAVKT